MARVRPRVRAAEIVARERAPEHWAKPQERQSEPGADYWFRYPELRDLPKRDAAKVAAHLDAMSEDERARLLCQIREAQT